MGKIYAIVNQKNEYYNDWNDSFIKKINQDILYFDLKCAESILKNLNDRDDMYCDGCRIVELTIYPKQQIADLEAKLAESEARIACREDNIKFKETNIKQLNWILDGKKKDIDQLKQQLAETDKLMQEYLSKCLSLEQQLAEKDKEIEELKKGVYKVTLGTTPSNQIDFTENFYVIQNQTAIEALEKVKESLEDCYGYDYPHLYHFIQSKVDEKIDQQIAELKGEK